MLYLTLFLTFVKIGMFTIGGGYAMIPLIEREIIRHGWMTQKDFVELMAVSQSLPGVFAVNISIFVGYRLRKFWGSFFCAMGTILPSFVIMLAIAMFFQAFQDNVWVVRAFDGIRPAVVALIVIPCINAARTIGLRGLQWLIPAAGAVLIWKAGVSPIWIVLAGIAGGMAYTLWLKDKLKTNEER